MSFFIYLKWFSLFKLKGTRNLPYFNLCKTPSVSVILQKLLDQRHTQLKIFIFILFIHNSWNSYLVCFAQ
jgi:hypothetical protein